MSNNRISIKDLNGHLTTVNNIDGLTINFLGENSQIVVGEGSIFRSSWIKIGDDSTIHIEKTAPRGINSIGINMEGSPNSELYIDQDFSVEGCYFGMSNESYLSVKIGKGCMFSISILFTATDGHIIYDKYSKKLLNRSKPIIIGDHVWIGHSVTILKGSIIPDNSIIATGAIVTRAFTEKNIIVAGNPAIIVKRGICWDKRYIDQYNLYNYKDSFSVKKKSINADMEHTNRNNTIKLNVFQRLGCKFFGLAFRPFINEKQLLKLKKTPSYFFKDSKNSFTRIIGILLRII